MLRKLLSAAAIWLLGAGFATAQESTVKIGETSYNDLAAAVAAVQDGETITITGTHVFSGDRINVMGKKFTLQGEGAEAKLVRGEKNLRNLFFLFGKDAVASEVTIDNVTFDGDNLEGVANKIIEVKDGAKVNINNCNFENCTNTAITAKAPVTLNNVKAKNCKTLILVGQNDAVTLAGSADYTVEIERNYMVKAGEGLNGHIDLRIGVYESDKVLVSGCTAFDMFSLVNVPAGELYKLEAKDGNIVLVSEKSVVRNENSNKLYASLKEAIAEAAVNDVLIVLEDINVNERIDNRDSDKNNRNLTIKGADPDNKVVLTRTYTNGFFAIGYGYLTFENIVFDCNNLANDKFEFENNAGTMTFKNVEIRNSASSKGIVTMRNTTTIALEGFTKVNCNSTQPDIQLSGKMNISGNNNLSVNVTNANAGVITATGELTNTEPIMLTLPATAQFGDVVVKNTLQYKNFELTNQGWYLNRDKANNNLILSNKKVTGIEDVAVDGEEAAAEYFTLSGVRVAAEGLAPGIYVKRQGGKAVKVYVK